MANEITLNASVNLSNGLIQFGRTLYARITQSTSGYAANTQTITTTAAALTIPADIATPGVCLFVNTDTTNYVELGNNVSGTFYAFVKIPPGEQYVFRLGTAAPYARANTASVKLECAYLAN